MMTGIHYSRRLTERESDVLAVAAEMVRAKWDDGVPDWLADRMAAWVLRLAASNRELLRSLRVEPVPSSPVAHKGGPVNQPHHTERYTTPASARIVIRDYLVHQPDQDDWDWEDHCDGIAGGILSSLRAAGFWLLRQPDPRLCYECGDFVAVTEGEQHGRAGWVHHACMMADEIPAHTQEADRVGDLVQLATADDKAWEFIAWLAEDAACDCECEGHEDGEPCTDECRQCMWCRANDLLVLRNQQVAHSPRDVGDRL